VVDLALAVHRDEARRQARQPQPALDRRHADPEARGHLRDAQVLVLDQLAERDHLVGRVHGLAARVLRERDLPRPRRLAQAALHKLRGGPSPLRGQQLHRAQPPPPGDHAIPAVVARHHAQALQQPLRLDQRGQLVQPLGPVHAPHVGLVEHELLERHQQVAGKGGRRCLRGDGRLLSSRGVDGGPAGTRLGALSGRTRAGTGTITGRGLRIGARIGIGIGIGIGSHFGVLCMNEWMNG